MLDVGRNHDVAGRRLSRRSLLQVGALGACGPSLALWLRHLRAVAAEGNGSADPSVRRPAKSVILLWLWGGPSHLDTFDLKPQAPAEYRGPYSPIATRVGGLEICELLPRLALQSNRFALIRSMRHESNDHGIAGTIGLTGAIAGARSLGGQTITGSVKSTHGAIASRVLGESRALPSFVSVGGPLHQGKQSIVGEGAAGLGARFDPFRLDYDPATGIKLPDLELNADLAGGRLADRRQLRSDLDAVARNIDRTLEVGKLDDMYGRAFSLLSAGDVRRTFALDEEPQSLRDRYGRTRFGKCCLLARRLVETGVRFVQVNWSSHVEPIEDTGDGGWDTHDRHFVQLQERHAPLFDQAAGTLLDDLAERGLLEETIVVAVGEFGRTPKINGKAGRDHWNDCYSALVAGGGLHVGQVVGSSDARAERPLTRPVSPADLFTTVFHRLGITTTQLTALGLTPQGNPIEELL
jgi:hypothetical protein